MNKRVSIFIAYATGACSNAGQIATSTAAIPIEFRPTNTGDAQGQADVIHNGTVTHIPGTWYVRADGIVEVWAGATNTSFWGIAGTASLKLNGYYYKY
jgi:hypothetical protein